MSKAWLSEAQGVLATFRRNVARPALEPFVGFRTFPRRSCQWSSFVVAQMLHDVGQTGWHGVGATEGQYETPEETHFWLEFEGWVLDPTADPFLDRFEEPLLA